MFDAVDIATAYMADSIDDVLDETLQPLALQHGLRVYFDSQRQEDPVVLRCAFYTDTGNGTHRTDVNGTEDLRQTCRAALANVLSQFMVDKLEPVVIQRVVRTAYGEFQPREQEEIMAKAEVLLGRRKGAAGESASGGAASVLQHDPGDRRTYLYECLQNYLQEQNSLHLEGFIRFRAPDYLNAIEEMVDRAADDIMLRGEYHEFLQLLRHFVEVQNPRLDLCHVLFDADGDFRTLDNDGQEIVDEEILRLRREQQVPNVDLQDLLISALVNISPRQVLLHDPHGICHHTTAEALRRIFPRRVYVCRGCRLCDQRQRLQ